MNDIEEGRLIAKLHVIAATAKEPIASTVLDAADAIETGRQWETIARRTWKYHIEHKATCLISRCTCGLDDLEAAFRDVADRTPTPTDGADNR